MFVCVRPAFSIIQKGFILNILIFITLICTNIINLMLFYFLGEELLKIKIDTECTWEMVLKLIIYAKCKDAELMNKIYEDDFKRQKNENT